MLARLRNTESSEWPDVLMLELRSRDADPFAAISELEKVFADGELPPVIVVAELTPSDLAHQQSIRSTVSLLVRPLTSSALFNAINSVVWKRKDAHDRLLQSTDLNERQAQWLVGVHALVVDDSDVNLEVAKRILEKQGATVATCTDGAAALEYVRTHHQQLDVVLMDVQMPILDGNEAAWRIRADLGLRQLPIVALTAGALVGERQRSIEAGMNEFVAKPFDPQLLIRKVRRLVEQVRGKPIPLAILDVKSAVRAAHGSLMSSIDPTLVQQLYGDDVALFRSVLNRMLRDYSDLELPASVSLDDEAAREQLTARTHKLKGSAGLIGATRIMRLAGAAEVALQQQRPTDVVDRILQQLTTALVTLREEATPFLQRPPEGPARPDNTGSSRPIAGAADIDELCTLLESQNLAALDKFGVLSAELRTRLSATDFERLHDSIDNLDFQLGATLLRAAPMLATSQATAS
jgi:CheY-like chemotaxis protein/HPt (histidine-containing phosphotransfer) domain-containing protein